MNKNMLAIDCGNSSIRVMHGMFDGETITLRRISQVENRTVLFNDHHFWDILGIFHGIKKGLAEAVAAGIHIDSIGVSTWGVDFGLMQKDGWLIGNPLCYRNTLGYDCYANLSEHEKEELFFATGILPDKINSMFMLQGLREHGSWMLEHTDRILMISGLINYFLTGRYANENSMLSTTQFLDSQRRQLSEALLGKHGLAPDVFADIYEHGEVIGNLSPALAQEIGVDYDIPVICVPAHDTASAVLAIPCDNDEKFAFVSSGTWGLVGTELAQPIISAKVASASLTNEVGAYDSITLLKNNAGMYLFQRLKDEYERETNQSITWDEFYAQVEPSGKTDIQTFDVNHVDFFNPINMSDSIWKHIDGSERATACKDSFKSIVASTLQSVALSYRTVVSDLETILEDRFTSFYIIGGGAQNKHLNKLVEKNMEKTVKIGSFESTSLGNILSQLSYFTGAGMKALRTIARHTVEKSQKERP